MALLVWGGLIACETTSAVEMNEARLRRCLAYCDATAECAAVDDRTGDDRERRLGRCQLACERDSVEVPDNPAGDWGSCLGFGHALRSCVVTTGIECVDEDVDGDGTLERVWHVPNACRPLQPQAGLCHECLSYCSASQCDDDCFGRCMHSLAGWSSCSDRAQAVLDCRRDAETECSLWAGVADDGCLEPLVRLGQCISASDLCLGVCAVAHELGCGEHCERTCADQTADPRCGVSRSDLLRCWLNQTSTAACVAGEIDPTAPGCEQEREAYDECMGT